jgi:hypothetical protein
MRPKVMGSSRRKTGEKIYSFIIQKYKAAADMRRLMMVKRLSMKLVRDRKVHVQIKLYRSKCDASNKALHSDVAKSLR